MSNTNDVIDSKNPPLLTLKGEISVHFLDAKIIEGDFAAQDAFNIFLTVEGEPVMIPRSQIRFIKGRQDQQIEKDTSQDVFFAGKPVQAKRTDTSRDTEEFVVTPSGGDEATYILPLDTDQILIEVNAEDKAEDTLVLYQDTDQIPAAVDDDDDDDGTVVLYPDEDQIAAFVDDTDDDSTFVLPPAAKETSEETLQTIPDVDEADDLDMTVLLDDTSDELTEELEADEDELTVVLDKQEEKETETSASLVCTAGPHIGQVLKLKSGIVTLGRSSDNVFALSDDKEISRHHAIVLQESGKFVIQDQNSLNGTFVNDEPVTAPRYLEDGDLILVGLSVLKFQEE